MLGIIVTIVNLFGLATCLEELNVYYRFPLGNIHLHYQCKIIYTKKTNFLKQRNICFFKL